MARMRTNEWGELVEETHRSACSDALRMLRRAENRRRMSVGTAQAIGQHFGSCERCGPNQRFNFMKRFGGLFGVTPKVRPSKKAVVAAPAPAPVVPTEATNGTAPAETAPKPKRVRKVAAKTGMATRRARPASPASAGRSLRAPPSRRTSCEEPECGSRTR